MHSLSLSLSASFHGELALVCCFFEEVIIFSEERNIIYNPNVFQMLESPTNLK